MTSLMCCQHVCQKQHLSSEHHLVSNVHEAVVGLFVPVEMYFLLYSSSLRGELWRLLANLSRWQLGVLTAVVWRDSSRQNPECEHSIQQICFVWSRARSTLVSCCVCVMPKTEWISEWSWTSGSQIVKQNNTIRPLLLQEKYLSIHGEIKAKKKQSTLLTLRLKSIT